MTGKTTFARPQARKLAERLRESRRFIQVVLGSRQVGKSTLVRQALAELGLPSHSVIADIDDLETTTWLETQWERARELAAVAGPGGAVLAVDEVHVIRGWERTVKRLWDEDTWTGLPLKVVLLGSSPLVIRKGLADLAGRFEIIHLPHWGLAEMREVFGWTADEFVFHGGYPATGTFAKDLERWREHVNGSLIDSVLSRDIVPFHRVTKPALMRRLLMLGCRRSSQIISHTKMLGALQDRGNTTALVGYLAILADAGLVTGLPKYSGDELGMRGDIPKLQVFNTALMSAKSGHTLESARADRSFWGRLTESAVGAHLVNAQACGVCEVSYWRKSNREVDFVVRAGDRVLGIEVKSGRDRGAPPGLDAFAKEHKGIRRLMVGGAGMPVEEFLLRPVSGLLG